MLEDALQVRWLVENMYQKSTVSLQKGASFDRIKICCPTERSSEYTLYCAKQILIGWVPFYHHRY